VGWLIFFIPLKIGMLSWFYFTDREFFSFVALKSLITLVAFFAIRWHQFNQSLQVLLDRETLSSVSLLIIGRPRITSSYFIVLLGGVIVGGMRALVAPGIDAFFIGLAAADLLAIGLILRWYVYHRWYWTELLPSLLRQFTESD
jgi:hypothetical protein